MYEENKTPLIFLGLIGVVALIGLFVILSGFKTVDAGEVAVVTRWGAVTGRVLQPGANIITPIVEGATYLNTKYLIYETMKPEDQKTTKSDYKDDPVGTNTKDGQKVDVYYTVRFSIDPTKATWVVEKFGSEQALVDKIIRAQSRSVARVIPSNYSAEELYVGTGKEKLAKEIADNLRPELEKNGLALESVLVREVVFDDAYVQAVEQKQIESVKVETAKNIAARAEYEKNASIQQSQAEAEKQRLLSQSTTQVSLQNQWISKWDGHLPDYLSGSEATALLQLPAKK